MNEKIKKKNKIIGISLGILLVLLIVLSSTYAYWQVTKSQENPNSIVAACLDFDVDFPVGITEENKWPISSDKAMKEMEGYTFTVTNNCPEDVIYVIGLESVSSDKITNYLQTTSVGIGFDGVDRGSYYDLTDLEGPTKGAKESKKLQTAIVKGYKEGSTQNINTHNLKLWIHEESNTDEQGKGFSGKLFITGGQKVEHDLPNELTAESCFEMSGNEIIDYNNDLPECGTNVVIPGTIGGVEVKSIDSNAFKEKEYKYNYNFGIVAEGYNPVAGIIFNKEKEADLRAWAESIGYGDLDFYYEDNVVVGEGQRIQYCPDPKPGSLPECKDAEGEELKTQIIGDVVITGLDLSQTYYLEKIEELAFSNLTQDTVSDYKNVDYSLTSLVFGKNDLSLGSGSFGRINVDNLITYVTLNMDVSGETSLPPFVGSKINSFEIKPVGDNGEISYVEYVPSLSTNISLLYSYIENINNLKIAEGITFVPGLIFGVSNINNLELPSTLKNIGPSSFVGLNVQNLVIPEGVEEIGRYAFNDGEFNVISFPSTLKNISEFAFSECANVETVILNEGLLTIGERAFGSMSSLTSVTIPSSITKIEDLAFMDSGVGTVLINRPNLDGVVQGTRWNGNLEIKFN